MAIDTREKRMSVPGVGRPWMRSHHTETIDEQWRLGIGNIYNGNSIELVSVVSIPSYHHNTLIIRRERNMHG